MFPKKLHILALIAATILVAVALLTPLLLWDENAYLANAKGHIGTSNFKEDFRFPGLEFIISGIWLITGESIFAARLAIIAFAIGTIYLTYLIANMFFKDDDAWLITLFYACSYPFILWATKIYTEVPGLFFILLSYYLLTRKRLGHNYLLAGLCAGIAFLIKFPLALFIAIVIAVLLMKKELKNTFWFILGVGIVLLPWVSYNYAVYAHPLWDFIEQYRIVQTYTTWQPIWQGIKNLFMSLTILTPLLPFGFFSFYAKRKKDKCWEVPITYTLITLIYFLFMVNIKDIRYFFYILPFMIIISYSVLLGIKEKRIVTTIRSAIIIVAIITAIYSLLPLLGAANCDRDGAILKSIEYLRPLTGSEQTLLSNHWPWFGYYLNVPVASIWSEEIDELDEVYNISFIAINDRIGDMPSKKIIESGKLRIKKEITGLCGETTAIYEIHENSKD